MQALLHAAHCVDASVSDHMPATRRENPGDELRDLRWIISAGDEKHLVDEDEQFFISIQ